MRWIGCKESIINWRYDRLYMDIIDCIWSSYVNIIIIIIMDYDI